MNLTNAQEIITYAYEADIKLSAHNGQLVINAPRGKISPELHQCLTKNKQQILEILTYHGFTLEELCQQGSDDWCDLKDNPTALNSFALILSEQKILHEGKIPSTFDMTTYCASCKKKVKVPSALANNGNVLGCPLCHFKNNQIH